MQLFHHYQPIVDLATGDVLGYEALARFPDGDSSERIAEIGASGPRALRAFDAFSVYTAGAGALPWLAPGQRLFLNVTGATADAIAHGHAWPAVPAGLRVVWELPEDQPGVTACLRPAALSRLVQSGAEIALDDLGEGVGDLRRIAELGHAAWWKLGRGLVNGVARTPQRHRWLASIVRFAPRVIAEGVEEPEDIAVLRGVGVRYGQGFALGRPAPPPTTHVQLGALKGGGAHPLRSIPAEALKGGA